VLFTIAGPPLVCLTSCSISATDLCVACQVPRDPFDGECEDQLIGTGTGGDGGIFGEFIGGSTAPGAWFRNVPNPVPEPTTFATFASGLALLAGVVRRRWK
jgi:hypothetical protein